MTWVLERVYEHNSVITLWDSANLAQSQACYYIQNIIANQWDMSDMEQALEAKAINDLIKNSKLLKAINYFNSCDTNCSDSESQYFYIDDRLRKTCFDVDTPSIFDDDFFEALVPDDDGDEDIDDASDSELPLIPYQAINSGATCRGPCGQYNNYAYADKMDNTFVCHGCKLMSGAFGNPVK